MLIKTKHLFFFLLGVSLIYSCQSENMDSLELDNAVPQEIIAQMEELGFDVTLGQGVRKFMAGYLVENDIYLTRESLQELSKGKVFALQDLPEEEHYRTTNLVTVNGSRQLKIWVDPVFSQPYHDATAEAVSWYNDPEINLALTMAITTSKSEADIRINAFSEPPSGGFITLGSAGFPTSSGDPHGDIRMNTYYYNSSSNQVTLATTIAHEMGHCIGFRHTDYFNRKISCKGETGPGNEGSGSIGAIYIPGTPSGNKDLKQEADSFMMACSDGNPRPFNDSDKAALSYLYGF